MGALADGSIFPKIATVVILVALLLHLIAFGSPHWARTNMDVVKRDEHIGLWKYCSNAMNGHEACSDFIDYIFGDWLKAAQSFMTLGFFGLLGAVAVTILSALPNFEGDLRILLAAIAVDAVAFLFILIGIAVWAGEYSEYFVTREPVYGPESGQLSWAFGVACSSCFLTLVAVGLEGVELLMGSNKDF